MATVSTKLLTYFRRNIENLLDQREWGRGDLATVMGVTPSYVTQVLGGHRGVGLEAIDNFAKALDVEPSDLLKAPPSRRRAS
jgi:DNA-binding Xre family transcriptional regulator